MRHILPILLLYLCIPLKNYYTTAIEPTIILINDSFAIFGRKTSKSKDFTTDKIEEENNLRPVVFGTVSSTPRSNSSNSRVKRWRLLMEDFDYKLNYIPEKEKKLLMLFHE